MAVTRISDVIVPEIFTPYVQLRTTELSALVQSGVIARDAALDALLAGAGLTFQLPRWNDLANDEENIGNDDETDQSSAKKRSTLKEVGVRLNRNNSWSDMDLVAVLNGSDPMANMGDLVANYWQRRLQVAAIAAFQGVFADNDAAPSGTEHVQGDLTVDVSDDAAGAFSHGVTDFSAESFIDACTLLGDGAAAVTLVAMHSIVYSRAQKNNLIDFIPDANGVVNIPTFLGRRVIVDDGLPNPAGVGAAQTASGVFHTWLMGAGVMRYGVGSPAVPTAVVRDEKAGNGAGQETLFSRIEWMLHPVGHKYAGTPANGGPSNAATANNLAAAGSWQRVYPERKQIKIARLITRES